MEKILEILKQHTKLTEDIIARSADEWVNLLVTSKSIQQKYPKDEVLKGIVTACKEAIIENSPSVALDEVYAYIQSYMEEIDRRQKTKRAWRRADSENGFRSKLSTVAKRRYFRHKNKYKRALNPWKDANEGKAFETNLINLNYEYGRIHENKAPSFNNLIKLEKAISSAFTHYLIGIEVSSENTQLLESLTELNNAALEDLSRCVAEYKNMSSGILNAVYSNSLNLFTELYTKHNIEVLPPEDLESESNE